MKKLFLIVMVVLTGFSLIACGEGKSSSGNSGKAYPADVVQNFMESCTTTGGNSRQCSCAIGKIQSRYTLDEFKKIEQDLAQGKSHPELVTIAQSCR